MAERKQTASRGVRRRRRSRLAWFLSGCLASVTLASGSGCSTLQGLGNTLKQEDCIDELLISHRNRAWAARAWYREEPQHCHRQHIADFRNGFEAGYIGVAEGGDGCTPAIAPSGYWGWKYQSAEGQGKVAAWFAGYPLGAAAAEQDGLGNWSQIQTNFPQRVTMPAYQGQGVQHGSEGPVPVVPVGSEFAPTAADVAPGTDSVPNVLDWSAVETNPALSAADGAP